MELIFEKGEKVICGNPYEKTTKGVLQHGASSLFPKVDENWKEFIMDDRGYMVEVDGYILNYKWIQKGEIKC